MDGSPLRWQPVGKTQGVPSEKSANITTMGFYNRQNIFFGYQLIGTSDSNLIIKCFDAFANEINQIKDPKKHTGGVPFIIIDNAPTHTSDAFLAKLKEWKLKNLFVQFIPAYCPELNRAANRYIEILWKHIKYHWMTIDAYKNIETLTLELDKILNQIGSKYRITFT